MTSTRNSYVKIQYLWSDDYKPSQSDSNIDILPGISTDDTIFLKLNVTHQIVKQKPRKKPVPRH